jgi:ArsR family transcriptional regulator
MNKKFSCCDSSKIESTNVSNLSSLLKLTSEENRLRILCILNKGQHCVCEIEEHLKLSQSLISHHLKDLKDAKLISDEKKGLWVYYSLTEKGKEVTKKLLSLQ